MSLARLIIVGVALAWILFSQDTRPSDPNFRYRFGIRHVDMGENVVYLIEDVQIRVGELDLRADTAVVWLAPGAQIEDLASRPKPVSTTANDWSRIVRDYVREIYVDGTVIVRQGEETTVASAAYFDFVHDRGVVLDAATTYSIPRPGRSDLRLNVRAEELRVLAADRLEAIGVQATTCTFGHPHYHVAIEKLELLRKTGQIRAPRVGEQPSSRPTSGFVYTAKDPTLKIGSTSVFWFPDVSADTTDPNNLGFAALQDLRIGSSGRYGAYAGLTVGSDIFANGERWGTWAVLGDWRSSRGFGGGVDLTWRTPDYEGRLNTYYQRDHGEDRLYGRPDTKNRDRVSFTHRHWLPWDVRLDLEVNDFSDRAFLPTYYESEYRNEKPPETYAYLFRPGFNSATTALFSTRLNDWETGTFYEPRADWTLVAEPIAEIAESPLYFTARAEVAQVTRKFDDLLAINDISTARIDVDTLLEYPFTLDRIKVTPFAGLRTTYYEEDLLGNTDRVRTGLTFGAEVSLQAWKIFEADGGLFGLDGLRHIMRPSIRYQRITGVNVSPNDLAYYDTTDSLDNTDEVRFELRNLFQTHRKRNGETVVDDFADLRLELTWRPGNASLPGSVAPEWGPLYSDNVFRFSDRIEFLTDFEVDVENGWIPRVNAAVGYKFSDAFKTYAGVRHFSTQWDVVFGQINWQASDKWLVRGYGDYDFNDGRGIENVVALTRLGDDAVFSLEFRANYARDDIGVNLVFSPRAFFDPLLGNRRGYLDPRFQYLGDGIHK